MRSWLSPAALTKRSAAHPKRVIAVWLGLLAVSLTVVALLLADALSPAQNFVNTPESIRAADAFETITGTPDTVVEQVVISARNGTFTQPANSAAADALTAKLTALGPTVVKSVVPPSANPAQISSDGRTAVIAVVMAGGLNDSRDTVKEVLDTAHAADGGNGLDVIGITGLASINDGIDAVSKEDLKVGETVGIGIGLLILLLVFGALVSALLPVMLAAGAIIVALALTALIGQFGDLSFFVQNMITMMGLAVGIDYSLFIISRYREERAAGIPKIAAIERAGETSSRAVFFSGMTVVVALVGLLIVPMSVFVSLALGAILVVLCAVGAALTLLPATLALLGDRIDAGSLGRLVPGGGARRADRTESGFWNRIVTAVMRRPGISFAITAGLLVAASLPYWGINTGASGISSLPKDIEARKAFDVLQAEFTIGQVAPARVPLLGGASTPENRAEIAKITAAAARSSAFRPPFVENGANARGAVLQVPLTVDANSQEAERAVRELRAATALPVGGATALNIDYFDIADRYLPIVVAVVLAFSFIVLLLAFRSIVVPILAILLNLLSVGAAFGLLTLVSQEGVGAGLFGFQQVDTVEAWIPIFLFAVLFGLSMDYHVFLLSRIRERYLATADNVQAITYGISSSGRLITGAALIMVAVFGGFAAGRLVMFQQMGFGLAVAVLLDATLVRGVLLPAAMRLLGDRNWYLPKRLEWLPHVSVEGEPNRASA